MKGPDIMQPDTMHADIMKAERMRISRITVWQMNLPLGQPYYLSGGRLRFDRLDSTFVRIDTDCLLYTSPSPRDYAASRMPSSA